MEMETLPFRDFFWFHSTLGIGDQEYFNWLKISKHCRNTALARKIFLSGKFSKLTRFVYPLVRQHY